MLLPQATVGDRQAQGQYLTQRVIGLEDRVIGSRTKLDPAVTGSNLWTIPIHCR